MKRIYLAMENSDTVEGKGPMVINCAFFKREEAEKYIDEQPGIMGRKSTKGGWSKEKYGDWSVKELIVLESLEEASEIKTIKARERALQKLTLEERKLLGLAD